MPNTIRLHNEHAAHFSLERLVWPSGPTCPHCGELTRLGRLNGLSTPVGTWKCYACRKPFTIRNGTIFHNSHVPLHVWLQALYLLTGTKLKVGSQRLAQVLGVSVRTAWHLKQKIVAGLEAAPSKAVPAAGWHDGDIVMRCASLACQSENRPGSAISEARYERFLAAVDGDANSETDLRFIQALHQLLAARRDAAEGEDDGTIEVQLELGLLASEEPEPRTAIAPASAQALRIIR
ncbi:transposase [Bosea sp. BK604]|uniref:transposase n=1 Tax=Bosea sp. BK604 TaxID=2512180 RepID=UPI001043B085|nr:transposase [Bosea sp. BK604]TCR68443.1 transposase-like protein [Bosea sp. BK604]